MANEQFFTEQREQSKVKATIVAKYFKVWANVMKGTMQRQGRSGNAAKIAYIDLFAGPGRYDDGSKSTPAMVLETAIEDEFLRQNLVTIFNDADGQNVQSLQEMVNELDGIKELGHVPQIAHKTVGQDIVQAFEKTTFVPTLFFVDPWGYKGLSLRLINSVLKDWGCDCIIFFNYRRINAGISNSFVREHMAALFGEERVEAMQAELNGLVPAERELLVVEKIAEALREMGGRYVLPFRFRNETGTRTSHHLIYVSKHPLGYGIMKEIMAKESSTTNQGVASFEYSPASERFPLLFELARPLDDLEDMLCNAYAGKTMSMKAIFEDHHIDTPYIKRNYKAALINLERAGRIKVPSAKRPANTFGDCVSAIFPPKGG